MNFAVDGGLTIPVVASTQVPSVRVAIPCIETGSLDNSIGAVPMKVYVVSDAELVSNGGQYELEARETALPIVTVTGVPTQDNVPVPIYLVGGS